MTRENSPRSGEIAGGVVPLTDPVGRRDCTCESWRFRGTYAPPSGARFVEFWVGTSATACTALSSRQPGLATTTCWQIPTSVIPSQLVGTTNSFEVVVPSRYLVDPINGACQPPPGRTTTGSTYFSVLVRPPDDMTPVGAYEVPYNQDLPISPANVVAEPQEGRARVTWSLGTVTTDGGPATVPENVRGIYVLCFGDPVGFDAGTRVGCDGGTSTMDGSTTDVATGTDATDAADTGDPEAATDVATTTDVVVSEGGTGTCGLRGVPAGFDPNNNDQFEQYRCTRLIDRTATSTVIDGLQNAASYRFAVVTQDSAGNRSAMSNLSNCIQPRLVTDFWEHYRASGGRARPGFCAVTPGPVGAAGGAVLLASGLVAVTVLVRRARRKRS